jgi:hypothetical protein
MVLKQRTKLGYDEQWRGTDDQVKNRKLDEIRDKSLLPVQLAGKGGGWYRRTE